MSVKSDYGFKTGAPSYKKTIDPGLHFKKIHIKLNVNYPVLFFFIFIFKCKLFKMFIFGILTEYRLLPCGLSKARYHFKNK